MGLKINEAVAARNLIGSVFQRLFTIECLVKSDGFRLVLDIEHVHNDFGRMPDGVLPPKKGARVAVKLNKGATGKPRCECNRMARQWLEKVFRLRRMPLGIALDRVVLDLNPIADAHIDDGHIFPPMVVMRLSF